MISEGVKVLMIVNLDSDSGAAASSKAKTQGIPTIDYDRLTLGGSADYYVSFDNVKVGTAAGRGPGQVPEATARPRSNIVYLNGSPTDNNATLFKQGYDKVLDRTRGYYKRRPTRPCQDWDNQQARHDLRADATPRPRATSWASLPPTTASAAR